MAVRPAAPYYMDPSLPMDLGRGSCAGSNRNRAWAPAAQAFAPACDYWEEDQPMKVGFRATWGENAPLALSASFLASASPAYVLSNKLAALRDSSPNSRGSSPAAGCTPMIALERGHGPPGLSPQGSAPSTRAGSTRSSFDCSSPAASPSQAACALADLPAAAPWGGAVTTLMVRNVPPQVKQSRLLAELDAGGFGGLYDFVYLPYSFQSRVNQGYAFVNFASPGVAGAFLRAWHRTRRFDMSEREAPLDVSAAALQGLEANVARWANRGQRIRNPEFRPFIAGAAQSPPKPAAHKRDHFKEHAHAPADVHPALAVPRAPPGLAPCTTSFWAVQTGDVPLGPGL